MLLASFSVEAQIVNIPDANFKAKLLEASPSNTIAQNNSNQYIKIDINDDGEIQESEALLVRKLNVSNSNISSLEGINSFSNLSELRANNNYLSYLNINDLDFLYLENNQFSLQENLILNSNGFVLNFIDLSNNLLNSFNLGQFMSDNNLIDLVLKLNNNPLESINLNNDTNTIGILQLYLHNTLLQNVVINSSYFDGGYFSFKNNPLLQELQFELPSVSTYLYIEDNLLLEQISLNSQISTNSIDFFIKNNPLLVNLELNNIKSSNDAIIENNPISNFTLLNCDLYWLELINSNIQSLDLSQSKYNEIILKDNLLLEFINLKNGINSFVDGLDVLSENLPELKYICVNEWQIEDFQNYLSVYFPDVNVNSYCSFVPGGEFYTIQGNTKLDLENNVCDENDIDFPNMKFNITNGSISGTIISNTSGNYSIPVQAGTHTITPVFENPTYFNVSLPSVAVTFPAQTSPFAQNFCVTPNGVHQDVEVVIVPLDAAIPGFDATYKLVYKNKGNTTVSGSISLTYMDNVMDFLEANPVQSSIEPNILNWNYTNLQPFETRYITVSFNLNSPQETPALNGGDVLNFTAIIDPISGDEMVSDNTSTLNQEVVNSFDPNDKTCLEGSVVSTELIGQYVHYVIRFENIGTIFAQNVVVKDEIDVSKFDLNSLIVLSASHQQWTRINGNKVEFIFENIQLPFPPSEERHGYIAFKIKLKNNLTVGDTFSNFAIIYFDYNFPIITEPATTTIEALSNPDFEFSNFVKLYPNPASATITIESQTINLKAVEIFNSLGQLIQAIPNDNNRLSIDVSNLSTGTYFVKVHSDKGVGVSKFVKQ